VYLYVDNAQKAGDLTSPYSLTLDTKQYTDGTHSMKVLALDKASNYVYSQEIVINIMNLFSDITLPTVSITSPANGAYLLGITTVNVLATDNVAISKVELYLDGTLTLTDTSSPYSFTVTAKRGSVAHIIKVVAYDTSNNIATAQITVYATLGTASIFPFDLPVDDSIVMVGLVVGIGTGAFYLYSKRKH
jgi:hypothetical protein